MYRVYLFCHVFESLCKAFSSSFRVVQEIKGGKTEIEKNQLFIFDWLFEVDSSVFVNPSNSLNGS
jgi:hypothetical protein